MVCEIGKLTSSDTNNILDQIEKGEPFIEIRSVTVTPWNEIYVSHKLQFSFHWLSYLQDTIFHAYRSTDTINEKIGNNFDADDWTCRNREIH